MSSSFSHFEQSAAWPPVIGVDLLSVLLDKTPASIFADRSRARHKLPPDCTPPGCKSPRWITADVINWLRTHQRPAVSAPAEQPQEKRRVGAPTKVERIRAQRAAAQGGF